MLPKKLHNRNIRPMTAVAAIIAMGALGTSPALATISLGSPVPTPELAKLRGGFDIGGMRFDFAFVSATCINGSCTTTNFNSNDLPAHASQLQQVIQVQQGSNGMQAQINGQTMGLNVSQQGRAHQVPNTNVAQQISPQQTSVTNLVPNNVSQQGGAHQVPNTNIAQQISPQQMSVTNLVPNSVRQSMPALTSIIQNTANNAIIQHISSLTMTVENATVMHQMVATGQILQQSSIRSLPIP